MKKYREQQFKMDNEPKKRFEIFSKDAIQEKWFYQGPVEISLLIRLLDEILAKKDSSSEAATSEWQGCYDFLTSTDIEPALPENITVIELFQLYIYTNCTGNTKTKLNSLRTDIVSVNSESNNFLEIVALETVFDVNVCKYFSCYNSRTSDIPYETLLQFGILKKIDKDLHFTHRTFAEYFVAECISDELNKHQNKPFFKFFCNEILTSDRYKLIRIFLDSFLITDLNNLPKESSRVVGDILKYKDYSLLFYISAEEGLLGILKFLFECCQTTDIAIDMNFIRVGMNHALHQAVLGGHFEVVKLLVEHGSPVDVRNKEDCTALHLAAKAGSLPMVKFLVEQGVGVDCKDAQGHTAIHEASMNASLDMVRYLLENGGNVNSRDRNGYTALHIAASNGDINMVKYLVENGADIKSRGKVSDTIICNAVASNNLDVVKYLVENGADMTVRLMSGGSLLQVLPEWHENVHMDKLIAMWKFMLENGVNINTVDRYGDTVLHTAIKIGYKVDYVKFLVEHGADVNAISSYNESPLTNAMHMNDVEIAEYLMDNGAIFNVNQNQDEKLYDAIRDHRLDAVRFLGGRGISLDVNNKYGFSALSHAVYNNDIDMIKVLLQNNVEVTGCDTLTEVFKDCDFDTLKFLVDSGANVQTDFGEVYYDDLEIVRYLLENGATFKKFIYVGNNLELLEFLFDNDIEVDRASIFSEAAEKGSLDMVKLLLEKGVDINKKNIEKDAPLHLATKGNHVSVIKCLLESGADIEIKNRCDHTPLYVATSHGCLEAAKVLLDRGANIQNITSGDQTALRDAINGCHVETIKYMVEQGAPITDYYGMPLWSVALNSELLELAELLAEKDPKYMCKVDEAVKRLLNSNDDLEEDNQILKAIFDNTQTMKYLIEKGLEFSPHVINKFKRGCDSDTKDSCGNITFYNVTDLSTAKLLIQNGAKVRDGSVLQWAIQNSNLDMCKLLIENAADINDVDDKGRTLLHMKRYEWGSISIDKIKYLIEKGAELKLTKSAQNVLHDAIASSHIDLDLIKYLLSLGQDVNCRDQSGDTPLTTAIFQGDLDVVRLLIENGAEVDKDTSTMPGVLYNATKGHFYGGWESSIDMVKYLIAKGANVNARDKNGDTVLFQAIFEGNFEMTKLLVDNGADISATRENNYSVLHEASKQRFSLVKYLIDKGASMDVKTTNGRTVLHEAACRGSYGTVKFFIENGIDVNVRDNEGRTPLYEIVANFWVDTTEAFNATKLMIDNGADVNVKTRNGRTPLHEAASKGKLTNVKLLIENGADPNVRDEYGRTPLFALVFGIVDNHLMDGYNGEGVSRFLLKSGANINEKADNGRSALHEAAILGIIVVVEVFVELGADVNNKSLNDCTPLHDAARNGKLEMVECLVKNGADIHARNKRGNTALDEAAEGKCDDIVAFLAQRMVKE